MRASAVGLAVLLALAGCGSDGGGAEQADGSTTTSTTEPPTSTTVTLPAGGCSTAGMRVTMVEQDLPTPVAATREAIFDAAVACDYDALAALTDERFSYTFGNPDEEPLPGYWRTQEADGQPVLRSLVLVLNLPNVERELDGDRRYRSWPSADQEHRSDADWDALVGLYSEDDVAQFRRDDMYTGWRAGIDDTGRWMYFVRGD